jgi:hypothetical protein
VVIGVPTAFAGAWSGAADGETAGERFDRRADQDRVIFRKPFDIKSC